jgi:glycosyltransferase involved in cell wall biosynthesis
LPQVSVVISSYNRSAMLAAALRSALGQVDVDLEVVVVDNGSTDGTQALLASWVDPRLRVIRNEVSLGSVGGRNTGITAATGEWIGMLDDDDLWAPDKLRAQLEAAERTGRDWVYAGCVHIDGNDQIRGGRPPLPPDQVMAELPVRFVLPGGMSNIIWRRDALDDGGLLDARIPFPADWDVSLRLARRGPPAMVSRPLVAYRQHGSNMSRKSGLYRRQLVLLERKRADMARGRRIDWGAQYRFVGSEELRAGARMAALMAYTRAVAAGDVSSLYRAFAVILPRSTQAWLIRTVLSDRRWLWEAEPWLAKAREREVLRRHDVAHVRVEPSDGDI